jgi:Carbohydrate-binding module 48 (Isoamylase N-terminal domain)
VKKPNLNLPANADSSPNTASPLTARRPTWEEAEGNPLPLGVNWIEKEQAFNFAVHSEHAESVTLLLYSPADLVKPLLTVWLDFLHNKSGRIWHCRIPVTKITEAQYYAYSVSGQTIPQLHSFDPGKSWSSMCRREQHRSGRESWTPLCPQSGGFLGRRNPIRADEIPTGSKIDCGLMSTPDRDSMKW